MALQVHCAKCDGCGKVATTEDEEPWSAWESLPVGSAAAVIMGLVRPKECPRCYGKGSYIANPS